MDIGLFKAPVFIQFIFGIPGGIGPEVDKLVFMKRTADRLFGDDYRWPVLGQAGRRWADMCGSGWRALFIARGKLATSNAEQAHKIRRIVEHLGCEVASPDEAPEILGLKGGDQAAF